MKLSAVTDLSAAAPDALAKGKTADAAKQFESLLIAQMLKSMRESSSGWLGSGEDKAAESAMAMAEEHFASALSAGGGFGLASSIQHGLDIASRPQKLHE